MVSMNWVGIGSGNASSPVQSQMNHCGLGLNVLKKRDLKFLQEKSIAHYKISRYFIVAMKLGLLIEIFCSKSRD